jgi:hypothetical protein
VSLSALQLAAAVLFGAAVPAEGAAQPGLTVEGTEFVLEMPDGRVLRSRDLVGATLTLRMEGRDLDVTIEAVEEDRQANGGWVLLHRFAVADSEGGSSDLCTPDAAGRSFGFPLPDGHGGLELTCTSGAIGKCVRWGYRFWEERAGGPPLRAMHRACVHLARADYGGDGRPATRPGVTIHICDRAGIRPCRDDAPMAFEAAWGAEGATCVAHPRVSELASLRQLAASYPALRGRLGVNACTHETARVDSSALLFSRSAE